MGTVSDPRSLPEFWRKQANAYEHDGVQSAPAVLRRVADELERALAEREFEELTLQQAAEESGYSYSHMQRLVSEGELPNVGSLGAPRVRRCDIPRKPRAGPRLRAADLAEEVLARREG
jgi:hypothetical protein